MHKVANAVCYVQLAYRQSTNYITRASFRRHALIQLRVIFFINLGPLNRYELFFISQQLSGIHIVRSHALIDYIT